MKKVLIVDDDTIVRITLRTMIDWEKHGFEIVEDASNGEQALEVLRNRPVDLMIVDMKMPIMDGIHLLRKISEEKFSVCSVVLSSYDDFKMVREAFRLGAFDYLLKGDINEEILVRLLNKLKNEYFNSQKAEEQEEENRAEEQTGKELSKEMRLINMAMGRETPEEELVSGFYYLVQFEIDDFSKHVARFGTELETELVQPFMEFARQIPRVAAKCMMGAISPSRYLLYYRSAEGKEGQDSVVSMCRQLKSVWNNYMNLPVSSGISFLGKGTGDFYACMEETTRQLDHRFLYGRASICYPWKKGQLDRETEIRTERSYEGLAAGILAADEHKTEKEKGRFFQSISGMEVEEGRKECLSLILLIARKLQGTYNNLWSMFQEDVNYYEKLERLDQVRGLELWMNNYLRWILDYLIHASDNRQSDIMSRAKRFIQDNYSNPELTLGSVASYVELNEKYFSSRFTKEVGNTFSNYVTEVRIRKAKELMDNTNLKMYEISEKVGYNNVEHFTRVFKKVCKISPGAYKKSEIPGEKSEI